ncbi:MAG TPA: glycosyltransferase family 39 protein [Anaerolineales bacterium]|nr:glycosyltransferase family 39 protein [Anaerolineales bacterium]
MQRKNVSNILLYLVLTAVFLAPRLAKIDSFVTLDEPHWLSMGANFYYALGQREFEKTVYEYQPAVTTMTIIAFAMFLYFPEYRGLGQGYLDYEKGLLDPFMAEYGKDPLMLLIYSRIIQIFVLLVLFLVLFYLLRKFLPQWAAVFALAFAMFDPFYLSQHRLMNHEGMVSLFVMISLMAFGVYLFKDAKLFFLLLSGAAAGFAQLSKSSAIAMLAAVGVMLLWQIVQERGSGWGKGFLNALKTLVIWFTVLVVTYFVFWPGMWVAPGKMLYEVYGNAFSYAFQGARLTVTEELDVSQFSLNTRLADIWEIIKILLYRTTPLTWLGALLSFALPFTRDPETAPRNRLFFTLLLTNAVAFILLIGIAQGRNSPHYILSSYISLNLLAGLGWFHAIQWLVNRLPSFRQTGQVAILSLVIFAQAGSALTNFPYYFTYRNPLLYAAGWFNEFPHFPYCEGLERAAQYLADLPDADTATVFSYYGRGCVSYYYPGPTISYRPYYSDGEHTEDLLNNLRASEYLIVYYANQGQLAHHQNFINAMSKAEPFHVIWLNGYEYVRIYKVDDLGPEIYEALANLK